MAKQKQIKDNEKDYETVNQFDGSQDMRADLDTQSGGDVPWKEQSSDRQTQPTGRLQEDRNPSRR